MTGWFDMSKSSDDQFMFVLKAANHQIIGASQMYESAQSCEKWIESVKTNGASKIVKDNT